MVPSEPGKPASIIGVGVVDCQHRAVGPILDVVICNRVAYLVLAIAGEAGKPGKCVAVPWTSMQADEGQKTPVLSLAEEVIVSMPAFENGTWPALADEFETKVAALYRCEIPPF